MNIVCLFRRKCPEKQEVNALDMIRKFLSGSVLDDAIELFGLARTSDKELPT